MNDRARELQALSDSVPIWFHEIDLGEGIVTPGRRGWDLESLGIGSLDGKSVLDIGAFDGFFSFAAERNGAERVVALDHYAWSMDLEAWNRALIAAREQGSVLSEPYDLPEVWRPDELPGRRGFDIARKALGSAVEPLVADFMRTDLGELGSFDVVLYLGVLYHMRDPVRAISRVAEVTTDLAVIETEAFTLAGNEDAALWEFYPDGELDGDRSNWWAPNERAAIGLCESAGFREVSVQARSATRPGPSQGEHLRLVLHARK
jgi:tRNA (mo5U34)-methyltransferase